MKKSSTLSKASSPKKQSDSRLNSLISRGLATNGILEKNDVINEIYAIWEKESRTLLKNLRKNSEKVDELETAKNKYYKLQQDLENTKKYTAFYPEFTKIPENRKKNLKFLADSIEALEKDINPKEDMSRPNLLKNIMKSKNSDEIKRIQLLDLYSTRSEELSYSLQRQVIDIEHSQFLSQHLNEHHYANVMDLVNAYKIVKAENDALRAEELTLTNDYISKRRNFTQCPNEVAAHISILYQLEFDTCLRTLHWIKRKKNHKYLLTQEKSFDDIVHDPLFLLPITDFSKEHHPLHNDDCINKLSDSDSSIEDKITSLKTLVNELQTLCDQTEEELEKIRKIRHFGGNKESHLDKLWDLNDRLFDEITKNQDYINKTLVNNRSFYQKIQDAIIEHRENTKKWVISYYNYIDLIRSQAFVTFLQNKNTGTARTLLHICLTLSQLSSKHDKSNVVTSYLQPLFKALFPEMEQIVEDSFEKDQYNEGHGFGLGSNANSNRVSQKNLLDLKNFHIYKRKKGTGRRKHKSIHSEHSSVTNQSVNDEVDENVLIMNSNMFSKTDSLILASKCYKIGGYLLNLQDALHDVIRDTYDHLIFKSYNRTAQSFKNFGDDYCANIHFIYGLSYPFLVKPKTESETQTEPPRLSEFGLQTLDPKIIKELEKQVKKKK